MREKLASTVPCLRAMALATLLLVAVAACSGGDATSSGTADTAGDAAGGDAAGEDAAGGDAAASAGAAVEAGAEVPAGGEAASLADADPDAVANVAALPPAPAARPGDRIIKEGTVRIEVAAGGFDRAFQQVVAEARRLGGDVVASTTSAEGEDGSFGSLTVRVPVTAFEDLLVGMAGIGDVRGRDIRAQDVSTEFVDLESRLGHLQAQERFYLGLLDDAQVVGDAIAVQQHLAGVQAQIEQIRGRLAMLEERTTFSRLIVELSEPGAPAAEVVATGERRDLLRWWEAGLDAFVTMLGALLVAVLFALPLLAVAVPVVIALWALRRRRNAAAPPASETVEREHVEV